MTSRAVRGSATPGCSVNSRNRSSAITMTTMASLTTNEAVRSSENCSFRVKPSAE